MPGASRLRPRRPAGLSLSGLRLRRPTAGGAGEASATPRLAAAARYPAARHLGSILLIDASTGRPVSLDYRTLTSNLKGPSGNIRRIELAIPAGTPLPARVKAYAIADVFPLGSRLFH